jgi:S1-C subfamily serine protease
MAGVASGLALATTLMAMQVADSMTTRGTCPYQAQQSVQMVDFRPQHGFLGAEYLSGPGITQITRVLPGTPAEAIALQPGDRVLTVNGDRMSHEGELGEKIGAMAPGARPTIVFERDGQLRTARPTLTSWPAISY